MLGVACAKTNGCRASCLKGFASNSSRTRCPLASLGVFGDSNATPVDAPPVGDVIVVWQHRTSRPPSLGVRYIYADELPHIVSSFFFGHERRTPVVHHYTLVNFTEDHHRSSSRVYLRQDAVQSPLHASRPLQQ